MRLHQFPSPLHLRLCLQPRALPLLRSATTAFPNPNLRCPAKTSKYPIETQNLKLHDTTWDDPYNYIEQEDKDTEAIMSDTDRLQSKLQYENASRFASDLSKPHLRWGPWLYYGWVDEGKQYPVLCRILESLNKEFISHKSPYAVFDFISRKRIEQKLLHYNQEAERFRGYAYEELSDVSPNHRYLAYTMYDKDNTTSSYP